MKKAALSGVLALLCFYLSNAQTGNIKPLTIGDKVPPLVISNVINYSSDKINLPALKGKLVILDFWSSWCGACISLFPHLQQLQERFGDSIAIILVNTRSHLSKDNAAKINTILSNVHKRTGTRISLPASFDNPLLDQYFPVNILPHEVWIAPDGTVKAITSPAELNEPNIAATLKGETLNMRVKQDMLDFKSATPLFVRSNGGDGSAILQRSLLSGFIEGIGSEYGFRSKDSLLTGMYMFNQSKLALAKSAYLNMGSFTRNTIRILSNDSRFDIDPSAEDAIPYLYCYDLISPSSYESQLLGYMQDDLKRYFNISACIQNAEESCLVLTKDGEPPPSDGKHDISVYGEVKHNYIKGYKAAVIARILNRYTRSPVICETGDALLYSVDLPRDIKDEDALIKAFAGTGLRLHKEKRMVKLLIISDGTDTTQRLPATF